MKNKIIYIGNFMFPDKNAAANRVLSNGKIFRELGYETIYIGMNHNVDKNILSTREEYDGFIGYSYPVAVGIKAWAGYRSYFKKVSEILEQEKNTTACVILHCAFPALGIAGKLILNWCRKNHIPVYSDVVDWLDSNTGSLLYRIAQYCNTTYLNAYLFPKTDGVIAISAYLNRYYQKRGCKTVYLPPLVEVPENYSDNKNETLTIVYAGQPFALNGLKVKPNTYKDRLDLAIKYFNQIEENYEFHIYGLNKEQYLAGVGKEKDFYNERIVFHGRVENRIAKKAISEADFTIFLRDINRGTTAGFPTKFAESIRLGTPVITTRTSNLEDYLKEGENGFFLNLKTPEDTLDKLRTILRLSSEEIFHMKENCRNNRDFCYEEYINSMKTFLEMR